MLKTDHGSMMGKLGKRKRMRATSNWNAYYTRSWSANSPNERMRLKTENDRLEAEVALLKEEIRIKDARLLRWDPRKRPQYPPTQRMAILELRAARSWSKQKTADSFHLTADTITTWCAGPATFALDAC